MIDVYTWTTPNGQKVHIMLEECGLPYTVHPVNIHLGEQFKPEFLKISPNNKIPAIVDQEGPEGRPISVFESGAVLIYLAMKSGEFMPKEAHARYAVLEWLMFQMASVGPMFGQAMHFRAYAPEKLPYAINRYTQETQRIFNVINKRLMQSAYIAGGQYTIADMALFPWLRLWEKLDIRWEDFPYVKDWYEHIAARPGVQRGLQVLAKG